MRVTCFVFSWLVFASLAAFAQPAFHTDVSPVIEKYCLKCHGAEKPKGDVSLAVFKDEATAKRDPLLWSKILTQVREGSMPPDGKPKPGVEEQENFLRWIDRALDEADASSRDPGTKVIHRLNRLEYKNTVRDLVGVEARVADQFPADGGGGGGFDNNAETLFIPPILLERYLAAAEDIVAQVDVAKVFPHKPGFFSSEVGTARRNFQPFLERAFRRPVSPDELRPFIDLYAKVRRNGTAILDAQKVVLKAVLASPQFLFRIEEERGSSEPYPLNDYELASRLSYFLWSSMPDPELFRLAAAQNLRDPATVERQVRRMLLDARADAFFENFAGQWLGTSRLEATVQPDLNQFPTYTASLRRAMQGEPVAFFRSLLREDASLLKLLDADYTFANAELARHYGLTNVVGEDLRRVALDDRNRGGILGMAGVLTLTSYPRRTSPVLRGRWVLDEIFGTPPPPPPPLVESLPQDDKPRKGLTLRQRLEEHRSKAECAACHARMDPLGFGLENFDAIGRWREKIADVPVDAKGVLTTGEPFEGPAELKKVLLTKKELFIRNLSERLLAYALGRGLEFYDRPAVKQITSALARDDFRSSTLILEIAKSYPFQFRRDQPKETNQ